MGTYTLRVKSVIANLPNGVGNWVVYDTHGSSNPGDFTIVSTDNTDIASQIITPVLNHRVGSQPVFSGLNTWNLQLNLDSSHIILDGNPAIDIQDLPAGFTFTSAVAHLISASKFAMGGVDYKLQFDALNQSGALALPVYPIESDFTFNRDFTLPPTLLGLFGDGIGPIVSVDSTSQTLYLFFTTMYVDGTYAIATYTWTLGHDGTVITIESDGSNPDLTTVEKVQFIATTNNITKVIEIDPLKFCTFTPDTLIVPIPNTCESYNQVDIYVKISGVWIKINSLADVPIGFGLCP